MSLCFEEAGAEIQTAGLKAAIQAAMPDANANAAMIRTSEPENDIPSPDGNLSAIAVTYVNLTYVIHPPGRRLGAPTGFQGNRRKWVALCEPNCGIIETNVLSFFVGLRTLGRA
jgi:hypothetical protein